MLTTCDMPICFNMAPICGGISLLRVWERSISTRIFLSKTEKSMGQKETSLLELSVTCISPLAVKAVFLPNSLVRAAVIPAGPEPPGTWARLRKPIAPRQNNTVRSLPPEKPIFISRGNILLHQQIAREFLVWPRWSQDSLIGTFRPNLFGPRGIQAKDSRFDAAQILHVQKINMHFGTALSIGR